MGTVDDMPSLRARIVVTGIGVVTASVFFFAVDLGGTVRGSVSWASVLPVAIWSVPLWVFALLARSRSLVVAGGALLNMVSTVLLVALFRTESSTAAIGMVTIPLMLVAGVGVVTAGERLLRRTS
jgi:hypothetical protein